MDTENKKHGIFPEPGTIQFERLLPGPPERIWDYLTKSELKEKWLSAGDVEPRVNGKVIFKFKHSDLSENDGPIPEKYKVMEEGTYFEGKVIIWEPFTKLEYTWGEDTGEASVVTYELFLRKNNKVLLRLTHRHLGDESATLLSVSAGWHTHLDILKSISQGQKPKGFWDVHTKMEKEYEEIISNSN